MDTNNKGYSIFGRIRIVTYYYTRSPDTINGLYLIRIPGYKIIHELLDTVPHSKYSRTAREEVMLHAYDHSRITNQIL